jgi:hypothetical protein
MSFSGDNTMAAEWMYAAPLHSPSISSSWEGVDRNDQLRQYYSVPTKCRKYYKYIFWFLFEVAITNFHILHSNYSTAPRLSLKEYRLELAKGPAPFPNEATEHCHHHCSP